MDYAVNSGLGVVRSERRYERADAGIPSGSRAISFPKNVRTPVENSLWLPAMQSASGLMESIRRNTGVESIKIA